MTGKLIKNDLKADAAAIGDIYLAAAIGVGALLISTFLDISTWVKFALSVAVIVIAFIAVIMTFVQVIFGANKNLFGREGYLTQTLPVRTSSLIFSKWLTATIWVIISYALVIVAVVCVYYYWTVANDEGAKMYDMIYNFAQTMGVGAVEMYKKYLIVSAIVGLFNACIFVMDVLFAITIANIRPFSRLGNIGIVLYIAILLIGIQAASYGLADIADVTMLIDAKGAISMTVQQSAVDANTAAGGMNIGFTDVYFKAIVTVFIYIFTVQLNETKINLK
jgi:hypothetical protein